MKDSFTDLKQEIIFNKNDIALLFHKIANKDSELNDFKNEIHNNKIEIERIGNRFIDLRSEITKKTEFH